MTLDITVMANLDGRKIPLIDIELEDAPELFKTIIVLGTGQLFE